MIRIWSETSITAVSDDVEFLGLLAQQSEFQFQMKAFSSEAVRAGALKLDADCLVLWDLSCLPAADLEAFLKSNPVLLRTCSLVIVATDRDLANAVQLTEMGAIDFIRKPVAAEELRARLRLARRPWVRAMRTTFDFLGAFNVDFTTMEQKILLCFLASPDLSASRAAINTELWSASSVNSNSLDVHLFNIRRKIEPTGLQIRFNNKRGTWCLSMKAPSPSDSKIGGLNEPKS